MAHAFCTPSTTHTETAIIWSPPLGLSHSSTTIVATAVILTLVTYMSGKTVSSPHTNMTVYCWRTSPRQQCSAANWKLTCSKLHSTCNTFKWCYGCENLKQTAMWQNKMPQALPFAISQALANYRLFYKHCDPSLQWPLIADNENFLQPLVVLSNSHSISACYTFSYRRCKRLICIVL